MRDMFHSFPRNNSAFVMEVPSGRVVQDFPE